MIAFDNSGAYDAGFGGIYTTSITTTAGSYLFVLSEAGANPTYNGVAMLTLLNYVSPISDGNQVRIVVYGLANVPGGINTLSVNNTGSLYNVVWASYTGVDGGVQPEASNEKYSNNGLNNTQVVSMANSVITLTDGAWTILFSGGGNNNNPMSAVSGALRATNAGTITAPCISIIDSNGSITPPALSTLESAFTNGVGSPSTGFMTNSIFSIKPSGVVSGFVPQMIIL